ncbi:CYTH domain-containing protein [Marinobacter mobilis]|uniref:CYTH domain-containing protein n=1 Tax=Marinobacter mobilis TaxID=488533 RepID=A0A1H3AWH4_9GAMM|nr:CYTH domain-containing protein [Marinobacter mobilis]SDX34017.1 CYTH domain-containing protein [Marinobacter mobilis]
MAQELEIKLTLSPDMSRQAHQWLMAQPEASAGACKTLINAYFDTPQADLNQRRAALRMRQAGDRNIQTLKTQGEFVNGAHRRQEWEWPVPTTALDLSLLAGTPLADDLDLSTLTAVFETNFERQIVMLDDGEALIECAFDSGEIKAAGHVMPLCELEFELKSGDESRLLYWARQVAEQVPFFINLISKAEQGYHLAGLHEPEALADDADVVTRFFHGVSVLWLNGAVTNELAVAMSEVESCFKNVASASEALAFERFRAAPDRTKVLSLGAFQLALLG